MPLDPARVAEARAWFLKAAADFHAAEVELAAARPPTGDVAFHAQQASEKCMKGLLAWHDEPFRKTHDLVEVGGACAALEPGLTPLLRAAAPLTEYAWKFRYPGGPPDPSLAEVRAALQVARAVFEGILARLPPEVRP